MTPELTRAVEIAELSGDGPHSVSVKGLDLVLVRVADGWRAYPGRCPHQGALLGEGELVGNEIVCRNHRWRFDAATGRRRGGEQCLRACPLEIRGDAIWIDPGPLVAGESESRRARRLRELTELPAPPGLPLVGNLFALSDLEHLHNTLERWAESYGALYVFRALRTPFLVISDPDLAQVVLRSRPESFRRMTKLARVTEELGVFGVFSAEGAPWRSQRRLAMHALSHRHLRSFYPTLQTVARRLRRRWSAAADRGNEVDVLDDCKRFTVDVTTSLVFGYDANTLEQTGDVIQRRLQLVFPAVHRRANSSIPYWRLFRLPRDRRVERALAELRIWMGERIATTRARLAAEPERAERPVDFLEAMLTARDESGRPFSEDLILGNSLQMLLAGEDTTANTLAWAIDHLCDAPEALVALRTELARELAGEAIPPDIEQANRLTYATAIAQETMRLRPVVPFLFIEPIQDAELGDVRVPKGTAMIVRLRTISGATSSDQPRTFRPERWLNDAQQTHDTTTSMPFGTGPRICPGRSLAMLEIQTVLAMLYQSFEVERMGARRAAEEVFAFTMAPRAVTVRLRHRQPGARTQRPV